MTEVQTPLAEVTGLLDTLVSAVEQARAMPMSTSCVVNRPELLDLLGRLRAGLPEALSAADRLLDERAAVVQDGHQEAGRVVADAQEERRGLLASTEVVREAQAEAVRIVEGAAQEADRLRAEVDDYVDTRLATFEVVLGKTLEAVGVGRERLAGRSTHDDLRPVEPLPG